MRVDICDDGRYSYHERCKDVWRQAGHARLRPRQHGLVDDGIKKERTSTPPRHLSILFLSRACPYGFLQQSLDHLSVTVVLKFEADVSAGAFQ